MVQTKLLASTGRRKKATAYKGFFFLFESEKIKRKKGEKENKLFYVKFVSSGFMFFSNTKETIVLPICQDGNLVVGRNMVLLKSGYHFI